MSNITIKGALAALHAVKAATKGQVVDPNTFIRRAGICGECPRKEPTTGISRIGQRLARMAVRLGVPKDLRGKMCGVCECPLGLMLATLPHKLHKDTPKQRAERPDACWVKNTVDESGKVIQESFIGEQFRLLFHIG